MKNEKGFTLLEVLLVVSLLGIILAITLPNIAKGSEAANDELCYSTGLTISAAIDQYKALEDDPEHLEDKNGENDNDDLVAFLYGQDYLRHELKCPSGGTYTYDGKDVKCDVHDADTDG